MTGIERVLVVGAGTMGSGIAQAAATAGCKTTMADTTPEFVEAGFQKIRKPLEKRIADGKMTQADLEKLLSGLKGSTDLEAAAAEADLIIEAVFEEFKIKEEVLQRIAKVAKPGCVVATNTSSLSVTQLATAYGKPDRLGGLHFFNPAAVNKLVEVVRGAATSPETFGALWDFALRLGKVPIETKDSAGFCVNRFFVPFLNEAVRLVEENVADPVTVDAATNEALGTTMGPFVLLNFTGVPIGYHAAETLHQAFGKFYQPAGLLREKFERKEIFDIQGSPDPGRFAAVKERLLGVLFGITSQLVDEGVATREAAEKGALMGLRWAKGPFALMNELGTSQSFRHAKTIHDRWGDAFPLSPSLRTAGERNEPWPLRNVLVDVQGRVGIVTIDRPEALNALNPKVLRELDEAFAALASNRDVRAIILTGTGKAFVAGADVRAMANQTPIESLQMTSLGQNVVRKIELLSKPVIAAVNGFALGGGCEIALACDLILAAESATFALPEVGLGIHPGFGGTQRLPRLIGPVRAKELIFTGERITAHQAEKIGLANKVVQDAELLPEALRIARKIAEMAPLAVGLAKDAVNRGLETDLDSGLALETHSVTLTFASQDQKEGMKAFLEKRKADFQGR